MEQTNKQKMASELAKVLSRRRDMEIGTIWADEVPFKTLLKWRNEESKEVAVTTTTTTVFLGSGRDATNLRMLNKNRIGRVLNVADDVPNYHEKSADAGSVGDGGESGIINYCRLDVTDFGGESRKDGGRGIQRVFEKARSFVVFEEEPFDQNPDIDADTTTSSSITTTPSKSHRPNILIHCANGSNRSATIVIALLMMIDECDLRHAWNTVKSHRRSAMPLMDNRRALIDFEQRHYGHMTMVETDFDSKLFSSSI